MSYLHGVKNNWLRRFKALLQSLILQINFQVHVQITHKR